MVLDPQGLSQILRFNLMRNLCILMLSLALSQNLLSHVAPKAKRASQAAKHYLGKNEIGFEQNKFACVPMSGFYCLAKIQNDGQTTRAEKETALLDHIEECSCTLGADFAETGITFTQYGKFLEERFPDLSGKLQPMSFLREGPDESNKEFVNRLYRTLRPSNKDRKCLVSFQRLYIRNGMNSKESIDVTARHAMLVTEVRKNWNSTELTVTFYEPDSGDLVEAKIRPTRGKHGAKILDKGFRPAVNEKVPLMEILSSHEKLKPKVYETGGFPYPTQKLLLDEGLCVDP